MALIGEVCWPGGVSSPATYTVNCLATAFASVCARSGLGSVTVTLSSTVSATTLLLICPERAVAVSGRPRSSTTACAMALPAIRSAYDATR